MLTYPPWQASFVIKLIPRVPGANKHFSVCYVRAYLVVTCDEEISVNINTATLAAVPLLEGLQAEDLTALIQQIQSRTYEKGETLFLTGDPGGALLIVVSGVVELFVYDENQNRIVLNQVGSGGFFGEVSLFDNGPRTANAIATETTEILILRQEVMVNFLRRHPDGAIHV